MEQKVRDILGPKLSSEAGPAGIKKIADAIFGLRLWREDLAAEAAEDAKAQKKRKEDSKAIARTRRVYHDELQALNWFRCEAGRHMTIVSKRFVTPWRCSTTSRP